MEAGPLDGDDDDDDDDVEEDDGAVIRSGFLDALAALSVVASAAVAPVPEADVSTDVVGMIFFSSLDICSHSPISDGGDCGKWNDTQL